MGYLLGVVTPVGVHEYEDVGRLPLPREMPNTSQTRRAVPPLGLEDDFGTMNASDLGRPVRGPVVRNDHEVDVVGHLGEDGGQGLLFVERRHEHRDEGPPLG